MMRTPPPTNTSYLPSVSEGLEPPRGAAPPAWLARTVPTELQLLGFPLPLLDTCDFPHQLAFSFSSEHGAKQGSHEATRGAQLPVGP